MTWREWFSENDLFVAGALITVSFIGSLVYVLVDRRVNPRVYTVKHGESIHRGAVIGISSNGVIDGYDSQGRKFYYRDGWEAVQELPNE